MKYVLYGAGAIVLLTSCATGPRMSEAELNECLQPNRRVVVEVNGRVVKPAAKPAPKPDAAKPDAAKPEAPKPEAKPAKPELIAFEEKAYVQGDSAFDRGSATLKEEGRKELDNLVGLLKKRAVQVGAIIVSGHSDRNEANGQALSEARAKAVVDYLSSRGIDSKLVFWEGKAEKDPVPVTKFCG